MTYTGGIKTAQELMHEEIFGAKLPRQYPLIKTPTILSGEDIGKYGAGIDVRLRGLGGAGAETFGWLMKVTPTKEGYDLAYIAPGGVEVAPAEIYIAPDTGKWMTAQEAELWEQEHLRLLEQARAEWERGPLYPAGMAAPYQVPGYVEPTEPLYPGGAAVPQQYAPYRFEEAIGRVFPPEEVTEIVNWLATDKTAVDEFTELIGRIGRNPETETLLRVMGASNEEVDIFFTEIVAPPKIEDLPLFKRAGVQFLQTISELPWMEAEIKAVQYVQRGLEWAFTPFAVYGTAQMEYYTALAPDYIDAVMEHTPYIMSSGELGRLQAQGKSLEEIVAIIQPRLEEYERTAEGSDLRNQWNMQLEDWGSRLPGGDIYTAYRQQPMRLQFLSELPAYIMAALIPSAAATRGALAPAAARGGVRGVAATGVRGALVPLEMYEKGAAAVLRFLFGRPLSAIQARNLNKAWRNTNIYKNKALYKETLGVEWSQQLEDDIFNAFKLFRQGNEGPAEQVMQTIMNNIRTNNYGTWTPYGAKPPPPGAPRPAVPAIGVTPPPVTPLPISPAVVKPPVPEAIVGVPTIPVEAARLIEQLTQPVATQAIYEQIDRVMAGELSIAVLKSGDFVSTKAYNEMIDNLRDEVGLSTKRLTEGVAVVGMSDEIVARAEMVMPTGEVAIAKIPKVEAKPPAKVEPVIPKVEVKPTVVQQMQTLRADIGTEVTAMQKALRGLTGDEAKVAREVLAGLEREVTYAEKTLTSFRKRPDLPDATKLRQTIMGWARYKGLPKTTLRKIYTEVAGRRQLSVIPQEQLVRILDKVRVYRPVRIAGKAVVTPKTEGKIQSLKDTLIKDRLLTEEAYNKIKSNLHLVTDKYVRHDVFITETDAKSLIRVMNDEATIGYVAEQAADAAALEANPAIKEVVDDYGNRIAQQGKAYFEGKPADASILADMRYYTGDLEIRTGHPFYHYWHPAKVQSKINTYTYKKTLEELYGSTPDFGKIRADKAALQRVNNYIAAKNNWLAVKTPTNITDSEIVLAKKIEELLLRVVPDYRYHRFLHFYHEAKGNIEIIRANIPDAPVKDIRVAIDTLESKGPMALKTYLDTRTWGVIESGFEPHYVVNPKLAMKRAKRVAFPTGRFQAREGVEFTPIDKDIVSRTETYLRQITGMNLRPYIRGLERVYGDAIPKLKTPGRVNKAISGSLNELMGYIEEGGMLYRFLVKFASQAYLTIFSTYPHLPFRNMLTQNIALQPNRSVLIDPRNKPLSAQDKLYNDIFVSQMSDIPRDLYLIEGGGLPGFGRANRFFTRLNVYGKSDSSFNRPWSMWGNINKAERALNQYLKDGDVKKFINNSGMNELNLMQQSDILKLLARNVYDLKIPGLAQTTGGRAAVRDIAREITENVHFIYNRAERAPISMGGMGRIVGSLLVFARSYGQRLAIMGMRLIPGSAATGPMKRHAVKVIIGNILAGLLIGYLYQKITGKKRNPYNPLNILSWTPGGIPIGVTSDLAKAIGDLLYAAMGDKDAISRTPANLTRLGDAFIPFYTATVNLLESLTGKEFLDRLALRKLREIFDDAYTVNEHFYEKERQGLAWLQHAMFGGEVEGLEVPPNPKITAIREEYADLFELYDAYGLEESTRYIEDDDARREARELLRQENPEWVDAQRRLEMYNLGVGDKPLMDAYKNLPWWKKFVIDMPIVGDIWAKPRESLRLDSELIDDYVARGRLVDQFGANSAEVHVFDYEHPELRVFGEDPDTFKWREFTPSEQEVSRWRLQVKHHDLLDLRDSYNDTTSDNYIEDDEERKEAYDKLFEDNPEFKTDWYKIRAYENDVPDDKTLTEYLDYVPIVDEHGGSSAEAKLFKLEHPRLLEWGIESFDWENLADENITALRVRVEWADVFDKYEAYGDQKSEHYIADDDERETLRHRMRFTEDGKLTDFGKAYYSKQAYEMGLPERLWETHQLFREEPEWGDYQERFLLANPEYAGFYYSPLYGEGHPKFDAKELNKLARDELYGTFKDQFDAWGETGNLSEFQITNMRNKLLDEEIDGMTFRVARRIVEAYDKDIAEMYHDNYVAWYLEIEEKPTEERDIFEDMWFEDDWFLMENEAFYQMMLDKGIWTEERDFSKVPSKEVWELYQIYKQEVLEGQPRLDFRAKYGELDKWLVAKFGYTPIAERGEVTEEKTAAEKFAEEMAEIKRRLKELAAETTGLYSKVEKFEEDKLDLSKVDFDKIIKGKQGEGWKVYDRRHEELMSAQNKRIGDIYIVVMISPDYKKHTFYWYSQFGLVEHFVERSIFEEPKPPYPKAEFIPPGEGELPMELPEEKPPRFY